MDFQTICRVCISENLEMVSIFEPYNFSEVHYCDIFKVIADCASVQIQKLDGFSEKICRRCLNHLSQAYNFKKLCEESDYKFRNNLIVSNENVIKHELIEEDTIINYGEAHNDIGENTHEMDKIRDFELIEVKQEFCEDDTKAEIYNPIDESTDATDRLREVKRERCDNENSRKNKDGQKQEEVDILRAARRPSKSHIKFHNGIKTYNCDICNKKFTAGSTLAAHLRVHKEEKPYKCDICDKKFARSSNLAAHIRHHTGEKNYECGICDNKFSRKTHLIEHIRTHTGEKPFKCDFCGKKFTHKSALTVHIRLHTGETPYECDVCKKKFTTRSRLAEHVRKHTGGDKYKCDFCEKKFVRKYSLTKHNRAMHNKEK